MKRVIAIIIILTFILAFFGCGKSVGTAQPTEPPAPTEPANPTEPARPTEPAQPTEPIRPTIAPTDAPAPEPTDETVMIEGSVPKTADRLIYHPEVGSFYISREGTLFCLNAENKDGIVEGAPMTERDVGGKNVEFFVPEAEGKWQMTSFLMDRDVVKAVVLFSGYGYPNYPESKYDGEYYHSLVYMKTDGTVWLRGSNMNGMFGDFERADEPVKIFDGAKGIGTDGEYSVSVVDGENKLWLFGGLDNLISDQSGIEIPYFVTDNVDPDGTMGADSFRTLDGRLYCKPFVSSPEAAPIGEPAELNGLSFILISDNAAMYDCADGNYYIISANRRLTEIVPSAGKWEIVADNVVSVDASNHCEGMSDPRPLTVCYQTADGGFFVFERENIDEPIAPQMIGENAVTGGADWGRPWFITADRTLMLAQKGADWKTHSVDNWSNPICIAATTENSGELLYIETYSLCQEEHPVGSGFYWSKVTSSGSAVRFKAADPEYIGYGILEEAPEASDMKLPVSYDEPTVVDLDFDGLDDTLTLVHEGDEEYWMYNRHFDRLLITLGSIPGKVFRFDFESFEAETYVVDCDVNDGRLDVIQTAKMEEEDSIYALRVNKAGDGIDLFRLPNYGFVNTDVPSEGLRASLFVNILTGGWVSTELTVTADGIKALSPLAWRENVPSITLMKDMKAIRLNGDGSLTIKSGARIYPYETDARSYVDFRLEDGSIVRVFFTYENKWLIDGADADEYYTYDEAEWQGYWY